jgi:hypothetical protein
VCVLTIFRDSSTLWWLVEIPLLLLVLYAALPTEPSGIQRDVKRSDNSLSYFYLFYTAFSVIVFWLPLTVESAKSYRIVLSLFNLSATIYLCFFNAWFRNLIIGLVNRVRTKVEHYD